MPEVNKRFFEDLLESRGMSLRDLARRMGVAHSKLSLTFSGTRRMQLDEAAQIAGIFGLPIQTLVENLGIHIPTPRVAVVGAMIGDGTVSKIEGLTLCVTMPDPALEDAIAISCRTAETLLTWMDGWKLFCADPEKGTGDLSRTIGRFCYVQIVGGPRVCATVSRGYSDGRFNLSGPYRAQDVMLDWATPILVTRH